jgi:hypothetical protein
MCAAISGEVKLPKLAVIWMVGGAIRGEEHLK